MAARSVRSRPTRLGWGSFGMAVLTMVGAFSTTNNLLYVLYSAILSALVVSWLAGKLNLRRLSVSARFPDQVFRGDPFRLGLVLRNEGSLPAMGLAVRGVAVERLDPSGQVAIGLPFTFAHRGLNLAAGLEVESLFPLGLFRHRLALAEPAGTAFPKLKEVHGAFEITADASLSGRPLPKKGRGDELYGIRDYDESDDSRLINWKLSAKAGKPLINEYCVPGESRVTIRIDAVGSGEEAERRISEAGSAFKYYVDTGAEVRLVTCEGGVDYGKGLLHLDKALRLLAALGEGKTPRPSRAAPGPPRGALTDTPALRRLQFAGAAIVYAGLFLIDEINVALLAALAAVIPLGWLLYEFKAWRVPRLAWDALSLGVLVFILALDWRVSGVAIANTHLVLYLLANRALNEVKTAELPQFFLILALGGFLVSGLTISPWYFLFFLLYAAFAGTWLMLASGFRFEDRARWAPGLAAVAAACLGLAGVVFGVSPRTEGLRHMNPFVAMGIDKLQVKSAAIVGFTEHVSLGWYGRIKKSTSRVMRIRPLAPPGPGAPGPLYVRGAAFDTFDGNSWDKGKLDFAYRMEGRRCVSNSGRAWAVRAGEQVVFPADDGTLEPALEFTCYPMNLSVLFTVGSLTAVRLPSGAANFDYTDTAYFAAPYTAGMSYVLYARRAAPGFGRSIEGYDRLLRERFLRLPPGEDGRVAALARKITAKAATDEEKAGAVESHLRRSYRYSTFSDSDRRGLPEFLFEDKKGNCEYFATAAAILLRHAGVPARLVTGFLAEEWNEYGKFYDVRQSAAHAWTEAYVGGRWVTLDATPPAGFTQAADALYKRLERLMSALEMRWYRHIIGYDTYVQRNTFYRLSQALSPERAAAWLKKAARPLAAAAAVAGVVLAGWRFRRRGRRPPKTIFERAQALLDRAGLGREAHLTPLEHARGVGRVRPDLAAVVPLVELHYLDRYGGAGLDGGRKRRVEELLEGLELALRK
ncbi:MAG: DUF3488 domain-containing protein [Elusimicrobia bacterium]|nr:DUF3488 domain-containing protein [Elusimicrobiota bacterium]